MIGKKVRIKTDMIETDVVIVDKILTNMANFSNTAVINNASFQVYVGKLDDGLDVTYPLVEFKVRNIIKIY